MDTSLMSYSRCLNFPLYRGFFLVFFGSDRIGRVQQADFKQCSSGVRGSEPRWMEKMTDFRVNDVSPIIFSLTTQGRRLSQPTVLVHTRDNTATSQMLFVFGIATAHRKTDRNTLVYGAKKKRERKTYRNINLVRTPGFTCDAYR